MRHHTDAPITAVAAVSPVAPVQAHRPSVAARVAYALARQVYQRAMRAKRNQAAGGKPVPFVRSKSGL
jgi:hypothetical protein